MCHLFEPNLNSVYICFSNKYCDVWNLLKPMNTQSHVQFLTRITYSVKTWRIRMETTDFQHIQPTAKRVFSNSGWRLPFPPLSHRAKPHWHNGDSRQDCPSNFEEFFPMNSLQSAPHLHQLMVSLSKLHSCLSFCPPPHAANLSPLTLELDPFQNLRVCYPTFMKQNPLSLASQSPLCQDLLSALWQQSS